MTVLTVFVVRPIGTLFCKLFHVHYSLLLNCQKGGAKLRLVGGKVATLASYMQHSLLALGNAYFHTVNDR